ncbi:MAG: glycosyltransferase family 1 protein [Patescibacteria group bacterium]
MRIGIDARFYGPGTKGLGRYTEKLIQYLEEQDRQNEYTVFLRKETWEGFKPAPNFKKVLADYRWYSPAEQIALPSLIRKQRLDLMHFPHFNVPLVFRGKFVVTIHDLILSHFPTERASTLGPFLYGLKHRVYQAVISQAVKKSAKIITVSHYSKKQIMDDFGVPADKITVTYEATSDFKPTPAEVNARRFFEKFGFKPPFLLYVGNAYPHKNLEKLLAVFRTLVTKKGYDMNLVLVGKMDYFFSRLKNLVDELKLGGRVFFPGYLPDEELKFIYQKALLYVFPSLAEGFGLPPLEAMAQGLPVAASRSSCLPEVLGEAAYYFEADDEESMLYALMRLIDDKDLRVDLRQKGFKQVKKYSWPDLAAKTLEVYQSVI